ncbi:MAG TPA: hypothetical protein VI386_00750 [Candidatus Sulfotelmatobacter sp.]
MSRLIFAVVLLAAYASAQDCPVRVEDAFRSSIQHAGFYLNVYFRNTADKEIAESSVAVAVLDSAGEPHVINGAFDSGKIKAGTKKRREYAIGRETVDPSTRVNFAVWPTRVKFADGSEWKDDGKRVCVWKKE